MKKFLLASITGVMFGAVVTTQVAGPLIAQEAAKKASAASTTRQAGTGPGTASAVTASTA